MFGCCFLASWDVGGALDGKAGNCIFLCFVVVVGGFLFGDALGNDLGHVLVCFRV